MYSNVAKNHIELLSFFLSVCLSVWFLSVEGFFFKFYPAMWRYCQGITNWHMPYQRDIPCVDSSCCHEKKETNQWILIAPSWSCESLVFMSQQWANLWFKVNCTTLICCRNEGPSVTGNTDNTWNWYRCRLWHGDQYWRGKCVSIDKLVR